MTCLPEDARASFALLLVDSEQARDEDSVSVAQEDAIEMLGNLIKSA